MFQEKEAGTLPGGLMAFVLLLIFGGSLWSTIQFGRVLNGWGIVASLLLLTVSAVSYAGLFVVNPNEAKVVTLFGKHVGSVRKAGFWLVQRLSRRRRVSMRVRNVGSG